MFPLGYRRYVLSPPLIKKRCYISKVHEQRDRDGRDEGAGRKGGAGWTGGKDGRRERRQRGRR